MDWFTILVVRQGHYQWEANKDVWGKRKGTIVGEPKIVAGWAREGLQFDGKDDSVNITNLGDFGSKLGSSTFEAWMKTDFNKEWMTLFKVLDEGCNMGWAIEMVLRGLGGWHSLKKQVQIYIDGQASGVKIGQKKEPSKFINFKEPVFVGRGNSRGKLARPFPGTLTKFGATTAPWMQRKSNATINLR